MGGYRIGDVTQKLGLSADTLRYYERIGLLPRIARNAAGVRFYDDKDLSRLRFIQRAQKMNFRLTEIAALLRMRESPQNARKNVRLLTQRKLSEVETHLEELKVLRNELRLLVNLCTGSEDSCPIIREMEKAGGRQR
jgi:DNA-binding transcriptional MerR regulator